MKHHIWLVERSKLFREGLTLLLMGTSFEVAHAMASLEGLQELAGEAEPPSLILLAVHPEQSDSAALAMIERACGLGIAPVVVLAEKMVFPDLKSAMQAGACGYLLRDISLEALQPAMELVLAGEKVLPSELVDMLTHDVLMHGSIDEMPASVKLSPQEANILVGLSKGYANKVIAQRFAITEGTVKVHVKSVLRKIGAHNRTEAAVWAINHGLPPQDVTGTP